MVRTDSLSFWKGKKVFITGHTGFKGSWLCKILKNAGAVVTGYSLEPSTDPSIFLLCNIAEGMDSVIGDIRDFKSLKQTYDKCMPDVVIHLAAQPIVRVSYDDPLGTYSTNVMGTANLLECIRSAEKKPLSVINVTTDKVYLNTEDGRAYQEDDRLCGYDPYSNSKSCSELVTYSYIKSFLNELNIPVSTARAGNVIGGGDFQKDRIIPDCIRAMENKDTIIVRNPNSIRPYQHVLEPLFSYLMIAEKQYGNMRYAGNYNIGPDECDCITTGELTTTFCEKWGEGAKWEAVQKDGPHEANFLKLDCSKIKEVFGWKPTWHVEEAIAKSVEWAKAYYNHEDINNIIDKQIATFIDMRKGN